MRTLIGLTALGLVLPLASCARLTVDPIEVQTIHIKHDVMIGVDKALEDFFAFQEEQARAATQPAPVATTAPANLPTTDAGDVQ
jgi:hypothetical protein